MSEPNRTTPALRWELAEWIEQHYPDALRALDDAEPELFTHGVPDFEVRPYRVRLGEDIPQYLIDLRLEQAAPGTTAGNRRGHIVTVDLVAPRDDVELGTDLDAMLSALLDAFTTTSNGLRWTSAEYVIRDETFAAYRITLNLEEAK